MIVTRNWLQEWIDIEDKTTEALCETFNSIGLEVDSVEKLRIPEKVVVGRVLSCEKHPDADKLNVCQVDIGTETTQIVCGAKNVAAGQTVAVATIGADLGNGFVIKKAKLRGVESNGMICGSNEIGLPATNEGIMILDESIGELKLGKELCRYKQINDDIIDIELTANRGDCLSIRGVARDLAAAYGRALYNYERNYQEDRRGVARVLQLNIVGNVDVDAIYRFAEIEPCNPLLIQALRIAAAQKYTEDTLQQKLIYTMHSTGVILRLYDFDKLFNDEGKVVLQLKKDENGIDTLYSGNKVLSQIGLNQDPEVARTEGRHIIMEASYIDPNLVSTLKMEKQPKVDELFYNTSRGSETNLVLGLDFFCDTVYDDCGAKIYAQEERYFTPKEAKILKITHAYIESFIGQKVDMGEVVSILNRLGLECQVQESYLIVEIPDFRTDIHHNQDIIEEIVRFIGIDNIVSKPLEIVEKRRLNPSYDLYKKRIKYRTKAAGAGFFESVHYFFTNKKLLEKYNLEILDDSLDLSNPISEELNTLRTTLAMHLIESAAKNIKNGQKSVALFELGRVVDSSRQEHEKMAFIFSGNLEDAGLHNHGKPEEVSFFTFTDKISAVLGDFTLVKPQEESALFSPYEYARVVVEGKDIGYIARLHANAEKDFDLPRTYLCEVDFAGLKDEIVLAKQYTKFPSLTRDLSLIVPKEVSFDVIKTKLTPLVAKEIQSFYPIDLYESEELGGNISLTVRFEIQSDEKTLTEEEITTMIDQVLSLLKEHFDIGMR